MKKIILTQIIFLVAFVNLYAQQEPMYSQYMFNGLVINPAYGGSAEALRFTGLYRHQWVGVPGAPKTATFSLDLPVWKERLGLGVIFINDRIGKFNTNTVFTTYSFRIKMNKCVLALGLQAGFSKYSADLSTVQLHDPGVDPAFQYNLDAFKPNFGVGVFFNTERFYAGLSVPTLINRQIINVSNELGEDDVTFKQFNHIFLTAGYVFDLTDDVKLKPSVLMKQNYGAPLQFDINVNVWFFDLISAGISYRTGDAIVGMVEVFPTKQLTIGYAYDYTLSDLTKYSKGSHEIMLKFELFNSRSKIKSPRYF